MKRILTVTSALAAVAVTLAHAQEDPSLIIAGASRESG
jgi:hypothetical protein